MEREGWYGVESFVCGYVQMISPAGLAPFPVMHADREYHRPSTPDGLKARASRRAFLR
jgi:hypothetical protein